MPQILVLGSGLVARPCIEYLSRNSGNNQTVACRTKATSQAVCKKISRTTPISLDVADQTTLEAAVAEHDLVISLVPFVWHASVIKAAIKGKTNVVTTSYVSPAMRELQSEVEKAGIVVMNEVGVDPGVDHLYAIKTISEVHREGGKILEFSSYCGGLPAPEHADNPLGFKFSWSPRGALLSQRNSASFLQDGKRIDIPSEDLMSTAKPYHVMDGYEFVAYPNRDSVPFRESYAIPEARTVVRGSLRYAGNPAFVKALATLGWLDADEKPWLKTGMTWAQVMQQTISAPESSEASLIKRIEELCQFSTDAERDRIVSGLRWFGLLSTEEAGIRAGNLLDTIAGRMEKLLSYQPGERDLVMLQHKFVIEWADGRKETRTSTLELLGDPKGYSAMAKSVGVTCGIATQLVLDGHATFNKPGIWAPYTEDMCTPLRERLELEDITMVERTL